MVALVPAVGVLWFMSVAMRNERLAVQEQLAAVYASHLTSLQQHAAAFLKDRQVALQAHAVGSPAEIFAGIVRADLADAVVIRDAAGEPVYPAASANVRVVARDSGESLTVSATGAARTLQSQAADFLKAGQKDQALAKLAELIGDPRLRNAVGSEGALIVPNAQLAMLKMLVPDEVATGATRDSVVGRGRQTPPSAGDLWRGSATQPYTQTLDDLVTRLNDYSDAAMPSSQRRFLMAEVAQQWSRGGTAAEIEGNAAGAPRPQEGKNLPDVFPTFAAEELAAEYLEHDSSPADVKTRSLVAASASERTTYHSPVRPVRGPDPVEAHTLAATGIAGVWQLSSANGTIVALFREERLRAELERFLSPFVLPGARVAVLPPSIALTAHAAALSLQAGELLPGWRLVLGFRDSDPLAEASTRQTRFYLATGIGVVAIIGVLGLLIARYVSAQMRLARIKNELVSTVSHELKTPLASMRALVDTLLADRCRDANQRREYLQLIAKENVRLSHLIENFLTFSRLERGQQRFEFAPTRPELIVNTAIDALADRLTSTDCDFTTEIATDLPAIRADADALATVLVNLLDNACKYTNGHKRIALQVRAASDAVGFEVTDNGVGIEPRETRRIFERFYQVDQSLTRKRGGCGLGLSIVEAIVKAHGGAVDVESEPGIGSTFRVRIPATTGLMARVDGVAIDLKAI